MTTDTAESRQHIIACEKRLLAAFENKDLVTLDELIHEDALFVLPNGVAVTKATVLGNYRDGSTVMNSITASDQKINLTGSAAVVSFILELKGRHLHQEIRSQFRYLRVWNLADEQWRVISTSGVALNAKT